MTIKIYSTPVCPYCQAAKALLDSKELPYKDIDLSNEAELRSKLSEKHNYTTVPMIFINDEFIGGFSELQQLEQKGKL